MHNKELPSGAQQLIDRCLSREIQAGVIGLGYVGLPLAVAMARAGYQVLGVDSDQEKLEALHRGQSYVGDVSSEELAPLRKTGDPDLSFILSATRALLPVLHSPMAVILESTTYPGTTREMLLPELEGTGLKVGEDLFLAFSPERVDPGRTDCTDRKSTRVVGGITPACTQVAAALYGQAL